jgi:glycosyltransferase involved in cell wall biosynthesis
MKIIVGMLTKNEMHKFLKESFKAVKTLADMVIVVDDGSTDGTPDYLEQEGAYVCRNAKSTFEENESVLREQLFKLCTLNADHGDYILIIDADEIIDSPEYAKNYFMDTEDPVVVARLFDMWSKTHYRSDKLWCAHEKYWPIGLKYDSGYKYIFNKSHAHCGRLPENMPNRSFQFLGRIKHMGWSTKEIRKEKYARYLRHDPHGDHFVMYQSILDKEVNLLEY